MYISFTKFNPEAFMASLSSASFPPAGYLHHVSNYTPTATSFDDSALIYTPPGSPVIKPAGSRSAPATPLKEKKGKDPSIDAFALEFTQYINKNWSQISKSAEDGNSGKNPKDGIARACQLAKNTAESSAAFVIVGAGVRNNKLLTEQYMLITDVVTKKSAKAAGAILGVNPWSKFLNDVFIYATMKARKAVWLALDKSVLICSVKSFMQSDKKIAKIDCSKVATNIGNSTALVREIAQLAFFGYQAANVSIEEKSLTGTCVVYLKFLPPQTNAADLTLATLRDDKKDLSKIDWRAIEQQLANVKSGQGEFKEDDFEFELTPVKRQISYSSLASDFSATSMASMASCMMNTTSQSSEEASMPLASASTAEVSD